METNNTWGKILLAGAVGIFAGWVAWGMDTPRAGMHKMADGHMMHDRDMTSMESMMHDMNAVLEGKTGDVFDQAFLKEMIVHHQGAVDMAEQVLKVSKRPELISLAHDIIKAQTTEIEMMKTWQVEWFN